LTNSSSSATDFASFGSRGLNTRDFGLVLVVEVRWANGKGLLFMPSLVWVSRMWIGVWERSYRGGDCATSCAQDFVDGIRRAHADDRTSPLLSGKARSTEEERHGRGTLSKSTCGRSSQNSNRRTHRDDQKSNMLYVVKSRR
jgi:hypothetical protein